MRSFRVSIFFLFALILGCSPAKVGTPLSDGEFLRIADTEYRKQGAFKATILWVGYKRGHNFESVFLPVMPIEIQARLTTAAFSEQTRKAAMNADASVGYMSTKVGGGVEKLDEQISKGTYKVFDIPNIAELIDALNSEENSKRLQGLKYYDEPRIVTGTAVVFSQESILNESNGGKINLSIPISSFSPEIKFSGSKGINSTVKLSDGTTFAYEISRLCFIEADNRIRVAALDPDRPRRDSSCPRGTYKSLIALQNAIDAHKAIANKPQ